MFEQAFKNIDDILRQDPGCATELDYIEQTSWILFLKYLDGLDESRKDDAILSEKKYTSIISNDYKWDSWAVPKKNGKPDHNSAMTGDDLLEFVNSKLFPYLRKFRGEEEADTIEYKIGEVFRELKNKMTSGYRLREILDLVDPMSFRRYEEKHELSHLYESKIAKMGNAGRNGGEYYTPRPLIHAIVTVVDPKIGETVYDGACGSAGFLAEAFVHIYGDGKQLSTTQNKRLQTKTLYGKEIKSLAYIIGIMNMILHGIEAPNILHTNTLGQNINDIQDKDRHNVVLANPPFGGSIGKEIQDNFPIRTGETAFLFLQHFIKILKAGGRAGIVIKNTFLSNTDNASVSLRKELLTKCNLHTVLDLPGGAFQGAGVKTVVLFFEKGAPTKKIWYYQLNPGRNLGKTNPLSVADLEDFVKLQKKKTDSDNSWSVDIKDIDKDTYDLSVKNPSKGGEAVLRDAKDILKEIAKLDSESKDILDAIKGMLA